MDDIEFKLEGLDAVLAKMKALPVAVRHKGARFAGRRAANLIKNAGISGGQKLDDPITREQIAKNITVRFSSRIFRRTGDVAFRVGIMGGARAYVANKQNVRKGRAGKMYATGGDSGNPGGDTFYWRFLEFGTQKIAARPFMRPALEANSEAAAAEFTTQMNRWLDRHFKRSGIVPPNL